jgi:hypothetical protein
MAATHHGFNVLKIPGANGMITVRCNEKDALRSVEHVYREAATMFPADEDLLEHSGDLARKKQLVSQERSATKKVPLQAGGCENFTTAGAGGSRLRAPFGRPHPSGIGMTGGSGLDSRAQGLPHQQQASRG